MDIRVGSTLEVGAPSTDSQSRQGGAVEARVLSVRPPRRRSGRPPAKGERRGKSPDRDPVNGKVLILMIPEGSRLPADIQTGDYRVFLRFARR